MKYILLTTLLFSSVNLFAQDVGGLNLNSAADAADGSARSGDASSEGDAENSDSNSKNQNQRSRPIISYLPLGVQQFYQAYPKSHFRFVSGDILSASFFQMTGLFEETAGDNPLDTALDRSSSIERHAGLFTFLTTATAGGHAINGIENSVNRKLGIEKTHQKITTLKNFVGLNILVGVYGYYAVDAAIKGQSQKEILELLSKKETFAAAMSMHLAFMGADKFMDYTKGMKDNLRFLKRVSQNPQALKIAMKYSQKTGLGLYKELLTNTSKLNDLRKDLQKAKITLGALQPETIPLIIGETAIEWTAYYVFAKVWDKLIHESLISTLNTFDQYNLKKDMKDAVCYASYQGNLHYDEKVIKAAEVINENTQQIYALMYAPLIDKQLKIAQKLMKLDYLEALYTQYFNLPDLESKNTFMTGLLDKSHELYELNLIFVNSLIESVTEKNIAPLNQKEFFSSLTSAHDANSPREKIHGGLNASAAIREHKRNNKDFFITRFNKQVAKLNQSINSSLKSGMQHSEFLSFLESDIETLNSEVQEIRSQSHKISGMSFDQIEVSHRKYNIDPKTGNREALGQATPPHPETVYELILTQKIYSEMLKNVATNEQTVAKIEQIQKENEFNFYTQVKSFEDLEASTNVQQ